MRTMLIVAAGLAAGVVIALFFRPAKQQRPMTEMPTPSVTVPASPKSWPSATLTAALSIEDVDETWVMGLRTPLAQTHLPPGTDCAGAYRWAQERGAAPLGSHKIDLTAEAHRDVTVGLLRIEAREVTGEGSLYIPEIELSCSAIPQPLLGPLPADFDLSLHTKESVRRWPTVGTGADDEKPTLYSQAGDTQGWQVGVSMARATRSAFYVLDVVYTLDGKCYKTTLDDGGKPFFLSYGPGHMGYAPPELHVPPQASTALLLQPGHVRDAAEPPEISPL
ncbi:hypothetical protein GCM10020001_098370 [Nonomuraea salmonea]